MEFLPLFTFYGNCIKNIISERVALAWRVRHANPPPYQRRVWEDCRAYHRTHFLANFVICELFCNFVAYYVYIDVNF